MNQTQQFIFSQQQNLTLILQQQQQLLAMLRNFGPPTNFALLAQQEHEQALLLNPPLPPPPTLGNVFAEEAPIILPVAIPPEEFAENDFVEEPVQAPQPSELFTARAQE